GGGAVPVVDSRTAAAPPGRTSRIGTLRAKAQRTLTARPAAFVVSVDRAFPTEPQGAGWQPNHIGESRRDQIMANLSGKTVAFLLTNGYEDSELTSPREAVANAGASTVLVSPADGTVSGEKGHRQGVDLPVSEAQAADFDAL